jgi:hypothetical protein
MMTKSFGFGVLENGRLGHWVDKDHSEEKVPAVVHFGESVKRVPDKEACRRFYENTYCWGENCCCPFQLRPLALKGDCVGEEA